MPSKPVEGAWDDRVPAYLGGPDPEPVEDDGSPPGAPSCWGDDTEYLETRAICRRCPFVASCVKEIERGASSAWAASAPTRATPATQTAAGKTGSVASGSGTSHTQMTGQEPYCFGIPECLNETSMTCRSCAHFRKCVAAVDSLSQDRPSALPGSATTYSTSYGGSGYRPSQASSGQPNNASSTGFRPAQQQSQPQGTASWKTTSSGSSQSGGYGLAGNVTNKAVGSGWGSQVVAVADPSIAPPRYSASEQVRAREVAKAQSHIPAVHGGEEYPGPTYSGAPHVFERPAVRGRASLHRWAGEDGGDSEELGLSYENKGWSGFANTTLRNASVGAGVAFFQQVSYSLASIPVIPVPNPFIQKRRK